MYKSPPKGYRASEYPLPHDFDYKFSLGLGAGTKDSTIITLLRTSEVCNAPDTIEVNPKNANFAEETGPLIQNDSIIPKLSVRMECRMSEKAFHTDNIHYIKFHYMPLYCSFVDNYDAIDDKTGVKIEDIIEMQHDTTNKDGYPKFAGNKLPGAGGSQPLSTINASEALADYGLTTTAVLEDVTFDEDLFFDALSYYTNGPMLKTVIGGYRTAFVNRDRKWQQFSNKFTMPKVKRGNPYTFCGILFHVPLGSQQGLISGEYSDVEHLNFNIKVRYDEWNPGFDQLVT